MLTHMSSGFDRAFKVSVVILFLISGAINVLTLSGAFYMLQVYDRVLTSHSIPTLVALTALVGGLYVVYGILDVIRAQILIRLAGRVDAALMPAAYTAMLRSSAGGVSPAMAGQCLRDVDAVRSFLSGSGPIAFLDLPWTAIFLVFVWLLSPVLGLLTLAGLAVLVALAFVTNLVTRKLEPVSSQAQLARADEAEAGARAADAVAAMGFAHEASVRFLDANAAHLSVQKKANDLVATLGGISKVVRLMIQSGILGAGAYLAILGDITAGGIIAASLAAARALAPVEQAIGSWRAFSGFRLSMSRLRSTLGNTTSNTDPLPLPLPAKSLTADRISVLAPDSRRVVVNQISFELKAGQGLAIVGRSGSGKSTLARALAGAWPAAGGAVRLDGTPIDRWSAETRGQFMGYMPQSVELFPGTIADNISRLEHDPPPAAIVAAAKAAGLHDVIVQLPDGYETKLKANGAPLSMGQRQQLALAAALYREPFVVVLDEPNANLDTEGEEALVSALRAVRKRGGIAIVVAHRRSLLNACDSVAILDNGRLTSFGPKSEVLSAPVTSINERSRATPAAAAPQRTKEASL